MEKKDRIIYLDILRIIATIAVVAIHVSANNWYTTSPASYEWNVLNFYDSIVRWAVPIFVMISGALFLDNDRNIETKKLYTKNILRIITAFLFWSVIYAGITVSTNRIEVFIQEIFLGHYHLWFLYMIIGLYMLTPILRKITEDKKTTEYFLIVSIIFTIIIPTIFKHPTLSQMTKILENIDLNFGYVTYFVLGYYLSKLELSKKSRIIIYISSILGFLITIFGTAIISNNKMIPTNIYNEYYPNVLLESIGVFVLIKNIKFDIKPKQANMIKVLSKYSFGIYLVHDLILTELVKNGLTTLTFNPIISVPCIALIVYIISLIISIILNKIPILNKLIV